MALDSFFFFFSVEQEKWLHFDALLFLVDPASAFFFVVGLWPLAGGRVVCLSVCTSACVSLP